MRISDWSSDVCSSDLMTILPEGVANVFRKDGHVAILRVGEAQHDASAHLLELRDLRVGEGEVDELHRGSLAVCGGAVDVLLGRADDALAIDLEECRLLDAAELRQEGLAELRIVDLEHHR